MSDAQVDAARRHMESGRLDAAYAISRELVKAAQPSHRALALHSSILKAMGHREAALDFDRQATQRFATSAVAWHNLAATLGDLGRGRESAEAMERAFSLGIDNPFSWGVMARAQLAQGDLDKAEHAYRETLKRAPSRAETAVEFADLLWMRDGDMVAAQQVLDACFHAGGQPAPLLIAKAKHLEAAGDADGAWKLMSMAAERMPEDAALLIAASQAAVDRGLWDDAERLVLAADALAPNEPGILNQLVIVQLGQGRSGEALATARRGLEIAPSDQSLWGWAATAARAVGDPLHQRLNDYEAVVGAYDLDTPEGWADMPAFMTDLKAALARMHQYKQHPAAQSLRHGSQTMHRLTGSDEPAIQAFFKALDKPIREHMAKLGQGDDPLRSRNTFDYEIEGAWSVRLRPGGFHKDHFHPLGWLSSAFYVETPESALDSDDKQGWIRFGQPPFRTIPTLPAEHYVRPKPGRLVLFPSYMWHGTVPFTTQESRMTIAFDAVPKRGLD
jgi:uncharacterized protein (TIGR02466 family)